MTDEPGSDLRDVDMGPEEIVAALRTLEGIAMKSASRNEVPTMSLSLAWLSRQVSRAKAKEIRA